MSKKEAVPEHFRKGPMSVEEIKAMRAREGMITDFDDDQDGIYIMKASEEKISAVIGRVFRQARKEAGLTQQEVAEASGVKRPNIARLEGGKHSPTVDMLNRIAESMGMEMELHLTKKEGI